MSMTDVFEIIIISIKNNGSPKGPLLIESDLR